MDMEGERVVDSKVVEYFGFLKGFDIFQITYKSLVDFR